MIKRILIASIIGVIMYSCSSPSLDKANKAYDMYEFSVAADMYEGVYRKEKDKEKKAFIAYRAAQSYRMMNEWRKAESWYGRAIKLDYNDPDVYYYYGEVLKQQADYDQAIEEYNKLKEVAPNDDRAEEGIKSVKLHEEWQHGKTRFVVEEARKLNSRNNDYAPSYMKDDDVLVFTSDREEGVSKRPYDWTGLPYSDLYVTEWDKRRDRWGDVTMMEGNVNTKFNEGASTFNERGNTMYYTQCNGAEGKEYNCVIMEAKRKGKEWENVQVLPFCAHDEDSMVKFGHPALSPDGDKLFFSSDKPGGYGGHDLYVSYYVSRSRTWGDPVNLGPEINTEGDEVFPFYKDDVLYFASNGREGLGGLDIFESKFDGENWSKPKNLKAPVNSHGDDFAIIFDQAGDKGFFSSNRDLHGDDIYSFYMIPKECALVGTVYNLKTKKPVKDAEVTLYSDKQGFTPVKIMTDEKGNYKFDKEFICDYDYEVDANKEKFFASRKEFVSAKNVEVSETFQQDLYIDPFPIEAINLEGIYYGLDSARLRPASKRVLDSLVYILNQNPTIVIELASHTDCRNTYDYNMKLSQRRADSAVAYLIKKGIDPERLVAKGYGESELLNDCGCENGQGPGLNCTEEEHQINRRTTFKILRTDYEPKQEEIKEEDLKNDEEMKEDNQDQKIDEDDNSTPPDESDKPEEEIPEDGGN